MNRLAHSRAARPTTRVLAGDLSQEVVSCRRGFALARSDGVALREVADTGGRLESGRAVGPEAAAVLAELDRVVHVEGERA